MNDRPAPAPEGMQTQEQIHKIITVRHDRRNPSCPQARAQVCLALPARPAPSLLHARSPLTAAPPPLPGAAPQDARHVGGANAAGYQETDEYIDDAMDSWNEASLDYNE